MNFFQSLSHISEFSSIKSFYYIIHNWTRFETVLKPMLQAKTISLVCQGKLMQVNQLFSQIILTTTCSPQCPAKEIILTISFHPLSFQQRTSYICHIRQPIKCGCLVLFDCRFRSHSLPQARWTAKRKRQWKRSFKYYQLSNNFVRLSLADLRRISITPIICGALF